MPDKQFQIRVTKDKPLIRGIKRGGLFMKNCPCGIEICCYDCSINDECERRCTKDPEKCREEDNKCKER
jgi:hypothetical protein